MDGGGYTSQNAYQRARKFFLRAFRELQKRRGLDCRPTASSACLFFSWHDACKSQPVRAGVLAHPPSLPTAGALGMADLLVLVIIADAAQNGMAGTYTSIPDACLVVGTIVLWNYIFDWLAFHSSKVERLLDPPAAARHR